MLEMIPPTQLVRLYVICRSATVVLKCACRRAREGGKGGEEERGREERELGRGGGDAGRWEGAGEGERGKGGEMGKGKRLGLQGRCDLSKHLRLGQLDL